MNTIKDLAIKWWEDLSNREKAKLTFYFDPGRRWECLFEAEIEDIFYQEVIIKWYVGKYGKVEFDYNEQQIKEIYLKKHTKEQPQYPIGGYAPGNYMCNCVTCKSTFQGDKRAVQCEPCAIKTTTSQSVDNTIDVEERKTYIDFDEWDFQNWIIVKLAEKGWKGFNVDEITEIVNKAQESRQPKAIEDNVWDEAQKEYHKLYSVKSMSGLDILTIPQRHLFKWLEQHYSLIKK